jgi:hypothetical protein
MTKDTLEQIEWKLWRARSNIEEIDRLADEYFNSNFFDLTTNIDRRGRLVLRFGDVKPIPPTISLLIGETAYQLRTTIDHLIFALSRPAAGKEYLVEFPLTITKKEFSKKKGRMFAFGLPKDIQRTIESLQPYHRRKWPETWYLRQLQAVNNWDKHRTPIIAVAAFQTSKLQVKIIRAVPETGFVAREEKFRGKVKSGAIIARIELAGYWNAGVKVVPRPEFGLFPQYDTGMPREVMGEGILKILGGAGNFIQDEVLPRFKRFF